MTTDVVAIKSLASNEKLHKERGKDDKKNQKISKVIDMEESVNEPSQQLSESPGKRDDLSKINGIGPKFAQTLADIGVHTFGQLAEFTPRSLARRLRSHKYSISRKRIENANWIGQARELSSSKLDKDSIDDKISDRSETLEDKQVHDTKKTTRENWIEIADFFVSFGYAVGKDDEEKLQTKVHHSQDGQHKKWEGISTLELMKWMLTHAGLPIPSELESILDMDYTVEDRIVETETDQSLETQLEFDKLWVTEQEVITRLQVDTRISVIGPEAYDLTTDRNPFSIEFYLVNSENNSSELVATISDTLKPGILEYEFKSTIKKPPIGSYQLFVVASLLPPAMSVTHLQGPIIKVEAAT